MEVKPGPGRKRKQSSQLSELADAVNAEEPQKVCYSLQNRSIIGLTGFNFRL